MPAWNQSLALTEPAGLGALASGVDTLATAANATLTATGVALDAAKIFLTGTLSPQAAAAAALVTTAQGLVDDIFGAGFSLLVVHPWVPGLGKGAGAWRYLSFPDAVRAIGDSFNDKADKDRPQYSAATSVDCLVILAGSPSPAIFKASLTALNNLLGGRAFRFALRRLEQAFDLDRERYNAPSVPRPPDWEAVSVRKAFPALSPVEDALKSGLALLEGYAAGGEKAVDIAASLITAKKAQLATLQARLTAARALFGAGAAGTGLYSLKITGAAGVAGLKTELSRATGAPGNELTFCAGAALVAPGGTLTGLFSLLGV